MKTRKPWTPEDDQYVWDHWDAQSDAEMARVLKNTPNRVAEARRSMGLLRERGPIKKGSRTWTPEEEDYLAENWGHTSISSLANRLNRTEDAIKTRAARLGLGAFLDSGDYVTFNQLVLAMGYSNTGYKASDGGPSSWIQKRGFPVHNKRVGTNTFRVVYLDEL